MNEKGSLSHIKKHMETCIGEKVQLIANGGRKKSTVKEGILENTYSNIFVVKFNDENEVARRVTYSYTDVLTKAVELVVYRDNEKVQVSCLKITKIIKSLYHDIGF